MKLLFVGLILLESLLVIGFFLIIFYHFVYMGLERIGLFLGNRILVKFRK